MGLLIMSAASVKANEIYNMELVQLVYDRYLPSFSEIQGVSSIVITSCVAGVPLRLQIGNAPDIIPEACIQITFVDEGSLDAARAKYGKSSRIDSALIYIGDVFQSGPQPGVAVHN